MILEAFLIINKVYSLILRLLDNYNYVTMYVYLLNRGRGEGPNQDMFKYTPFLKDVFQQGLDCAIYTIYTYRVAVDHCALNPTKVRLWNKPWTGKEQEVRIDVNSFKQALKAKDDVIIGPYDFSLLVKLLPSYLAVKVYNELTIPTDEERAEMELAGDIELMEYEALITYNKRLYEERFLRHYKNLDLENQLKRSSLVI